MYKNYYNKFTVLDENFLTSYDCIGIKSKVFNNQQSWQTHPGHGQVSFFPFGLYSVDIETYKKDLDFYKVLMYRLFEPYYTKILDFLKNRLQIEISFHDNLHYPGFHISNGQSMTKPNFHVDKFPNLKYCLDRKEAFYFNNPKILSVILVINTLSKDTGLLLRNKVLSDAERFNLKYDEIIEYKQGMLAMWDGDRQHSIKPFIPIDSYDIRLTMQCHIAISNNKGIIFW